MIQEIKKNKRMIIITIIIVCIFGWISSYAATNYAISSSNVEYIDKESNTITNVQAAIDGTCTKIDTRLSNLESKVLTLDKVYPIGSIYISTSLSTPDSVASIFGGTWENYGTGKVLKGTTGTAGTTGGNKTVKLTTSNLPSHMHSYTPSGTISSTFTGTSVTSGNNSATPTASFSNGVAASAGAHTHTPFVEDSLNRFPGYFAQYNANTGDTLSRAYVAINSSGSLKVFGTKETGVAITGAPNSITYHSATASAGAHTHTVTGTVTLSNTTHTHLVTAKGTVSSSFSGKAATTGATGYDEDTITAINVEDEYITVYMYRRTA